MRGHDHGFAFLPGHFAPDEASDEIAGLVNRNGAGGDHAAGGSSISRAAVRSAVSNPSVNLA